MDNTPDLFDEMLKSQALARGFEITEIKDSNGGIATYCKPMPIANKHPENTQIPIDQVNKDFLNKDFWKKIEKSATTGQVFFDPVYIESNAAGEGKIPALVQVSVCCKSVEGAGVRWGMPMYKKAVMEAISAEYNSGNIFVRDGDILRCMGVKNPTRGQKEKLYSAIMQMRHTDISIDASMETRAHCDTELFIAEASMVECRIISNVRGNGGVANRVYELLADPVLMQYARIRKRIISVKQPVWEGIPISLAEGSIATRDYLIERIYRQGSESRILWDTVRRECGISQTHTEELKNNVVSIMGYLEGEGEIESFKCDAKGLSFTRAKGQKNGKKGQKNGKKGQKNGK